MNRNLRFWTGDGCKITLKPGQVLHHHQSWPTDEGWRSESERWEHTGDGVRRETVSDGRDCDGRLTNSCTVFCPADKLAARVLEDYPPLPEWKVIDTELYDEYARAAGY